MKKGHVEGNDVHCLWYNRKTGESGSYSRAYTDKERKRRTERELVIDPKDHREGDALEGIIGGIWLTDKDGNAKEVQGMVSIISRKRAK